MTDWKTVHDSRVERPEEIDAASSAAVVYERRGIRREAWEGLPGAAPGVAVPGWVYEQRKWTKSEWAQEGARRLMEAQRAAGDADGLLVDHELRLTLLELGVNE